MCIQGRVQFTTIVSTVYANSSDNIFSSNPAPVSGDVYLPPYYNTCGMAKNTTTLSSGNLMKIVSDPAHTKFNDLIHSYFELSKEVRNETKETGKFNYSKYSGKYNSLIDSMKLFILDDPSSGYSPNILSTAIGCYKRLNDYDGMKLFLERIQGDKNLTQLGNLSKRFIIDFYIQKKDYKKALSLADAILKSQTTDQDLLSDIQFSKGLIYQYSLNKEDEAAKCYINILNNYPDNSLAKASKHHLANMGLQIKENKTQTSSNTNTGFSSNNYPNPFNPSTTINYTLPEDGMVTIKIFNALGQEINTLINDYSNKGTHSVIWNGKNGSGRQVTSGIYFYSITFNNKMLVKKMLMLK